MARRDQASPRSAGPVDSGSSAQRPSPCGTSPARDETSLLRALTKALAALVRSGAREPALHESFIDAVAGLGAQKGVLMQVRQQDPLDVEILYATGLDSEDEAGFRVLRSSPGVGPAAVRQVVEDGHATRIEDSSLLGLEATSSFQDEPCSLLCAPVADSLTGGGLAVLYFQNQARPAVRAPD